MDLLLGPKLSPRIKPGIVYIVLSVQRFFLLLFSLLLLLLRLMQYII